MLVQFMMKNVLSFKDEVVLDMTAINAYKEHEYNLIRLNGIKDDFLKIATIYGANASGKSNLLIGMNYFQRIIAESLNNTSDDEKNAIAEYYVPFCFTDVERPSEFQIVKILGEYEYNYGFEYNANTIISEWLYRRSVKTKRISTIIERTEKIIKIGASVKKECEKYKEQIPKETLALSFFNKLKLKTKTFNELYDGIMDMLVGPTDIYENRKALVGFLPSTIDYDKDKLVEFLYAIDTGIRDISYKKEAGEYRFYTMHIGENNKEYHLDLFDESDGTLKAILVFIMARLAIAENKIMIIDELNVKLHPLLLKFIIDLFNTEKTSAQLIYTTHDTTLLDKKFMRRDQIWFVEKNAWGNSNLVALSEYRIRSDASFEKDYLAGVYGGIPSIKEFEMEV